MSHEHDRLRTLYRTHACKCDDCPDSRALARLAAGSRWFVGRRRVVAHLAECQACAADLQALLAAREGLNDALHRHASAAGGIGGLLRPALAVAGVAAAFGLALVLNAPSDPNSQSSMAGKTPAEKPLFASDFDGRPRDTLFRDNFGSG